MHSGPRRPLVLVPGACLGGWAWSEVTARLRAFGHDVHAVTLTGLGERVHLAGRHVDLDTHLADVVNLLDYEDLDDVVLVGHSYAGSVITGVADRRPERLGAVVYLDTSPLPHGASITDLQTPEQRERQRLEVERDGDGWRWPVPDGDAVASGAYGSAAGLEPADLRLIQSRSTAQPYATFTSPLRLTGGYPGDLRRIAIFGADGGMSVALLRELIEQGDSRAAAFADSGWEFHELPTGHWAMFSVPGPLAELLHQIASRPVAEGGRAVSPAEPHRHVGSAS
jgi:pimeloyl-ACP methyl ester carboxylesterase